MDRQLLAPFRSVIDGHDAGHWQLPPDVVKARATLDLIGDALARVRADLPDLAPITEAAAEAVLKRGRIGEHPGASYIEAERERQARQADEIVLIAAERQAESRFLTALRKNTDALVTDALRPAFDAIVAEVRDLAPHLRGLPLRDAAAMIRAPEEARRAWRRLEELLPRWHAVLGAHTRLLALDRESGAYSPIRNIDEIYPKRGVVAGRTIPPPWPTGEDAVMDRVLWFCTAPAELWLPTASEEVEVYESAEEEKRRTSPVMMIERPVMETVRSGDRHGFPKKGRWTESVDRLAGG